MTRLAALAGLFLATFALAAPASAQTPQSKPASPAKPAAPPAKPGANPASTPAANTAQPDPAISPNHLALAREVMLNSGIARSFDSIIPAFGEQIKKNAVARPELAKDLDEVLTNLQPEMELQKQRMIDIAARIYAKGMSEGDLKEVVTFFRSAAGKKYVETQPQLLDELVGAMQDWTQEVSEYMMVRVRAEMGKRGHQLQ